MTIEERAKLAAWQSFEEIGSSKHSFDRVSEIIEEKMCEPQAIDIDNAALSDVDMDVHNISMLSAILGKYSEE